MAALKLRWEKIMWALSKIDVYIERSEKLGDINNSSSYVTRWFDREWIASVWQ